MQTAVSTITSWLPSRGAKRNVLTLALGQACGNILLLASMPLLTRLYSPEAFGLFATYNTLVAIWSMVTTLRYEAAIPLAGSRRMAWQLFYLSLGLTLLVGGFAAVVFLVLRDWGLQQLQAEALHPFALIAALNIIVCGGYQAAVYALLRERAFKQLAFSRIVLGLLTVCGQLGLAAWLVEPSGLVFGHLLGYTAACSFTVLIVLRGSEAPPLRLREMWAVATRFRRFPQWSVWGALITTLVGHLPTLFVAALFGPLAAGWYLLAHRCLSIPAGLLQGPVSRVYLSEAAELLRTSPEGLPGLYRRVVMRMFNWGLPAAGVVILAAPRAFEYIFGTAWGDAGMLCRVLAPMVLCHVVWICVQPTLDVIGRQDLDCVYSLTQLALACCCLLAAAFWGADLPTAAALMSGFCSALFIATLLLTDQVLRRSVKGISPYATTWPPDGQRGNQSQLEQP